MQKSESASYDENRDDLMVDVFLTIYEELEEKEYTRGEVAKIATQIIMGLNDEDNRRRFCNGVRLSDMREEVRNDKTGNVGMEVHST